MRIAPPIVAVLVAVSLPLHAGAAASDGEVSVPAPEQPDSVILQADTGVPDCTDG
ncbi:hypothetical protein CLV78_107139 [Aliiruegeria haliotis]|uniref:Uncharacterized protein n=1 Tax=Aliiruegeria haliotis TaxID=1280846 RepID=A0A2T0RLZ9_9RHOB|nr:hypothetical protein [Aliiruegeria haliotis]PRY22215.1 hypothetical protein CLV78_107139 [Aliiruegeria haliotis]